MARRKWLFTRISTTILSNLQVSLDCTAVVLPPHALRNPNPHCLPISDNVPIFCMNLGYSTEKCLCNSPHGKRPFYMLPQQFDHFVRQNDENGQKNVCVRLTISNVRYENGKAAHSIATNWSHCRSLYTSKSARRKSPQHHGKWLLSNAISADGFVDCPTSTGHTTGTMSLFPMFPRSPLTHTSTMDYSSDSNWMERRSAHIYHSISRPTTESKPK